MAILESSKKAYFGKTINVSNVDLKFSSEGKVEVDDEVAQKLIDTHEWLNEEGKRPYNPVTVSSEKKDVVQEALEEKFRNENVRLKLESEAKSKKIKNLEVQLVAWKQKVEELSLLDAKELEERQKPTSEEAEVEDYEAEVRKMTLNQLKETAEKLGIPESDIENKAKKESWIDVILEAVKEEDSPEE